MSKGVCAEEIEAEDKISPFKSIQKVIGLKGEIVRAINHYPSPIFYCWVSIFLCERLWL